MQIPLRELWSEARKGKSIARILGNFVMSQWGSELEGRVLDLACGRSPSYRRLLGLDRKSVELISVDYEADYKPDYTADLNEPLPFPDDFADGVILGSFLYIAKQPQKVLAEIHRVLRPNGVLLMTTPLVFPFTPEPRDFWRFTEEGIRLMLEQSGFTDFEISPIGGRWTAAANLLSPFIKPTVMTPLVFAGCLKADTLTQRFLSLPPCPLGHVVRARGTAKGAPRHER